MFGGTIMIDKIKKTLSELIGEFEGVCEIEKIDFSYEKKTDLLTQIKLNDNTIIRIYTKKKGLKIDDSIAQDKELANKIMSKWKELYYSEEENKNYAYENIKDIEKIKSELLNLGTDGYTITPCEAKGNGCIFVIEISDSNTYEKIKTTYYNSKKLLVQGYTSTLWENVCRIIERIEMYDVRGIVRRISSESLSTFTNDKKEDYYLYENILKEKLTEPVYNFLSPEDREYLISAQLLIENNVKFPRYNAILCPACLSLEGFFKKLLVDLKIVKAFQISNSKFNFGEVFNKLHKLNESKYRLINAKNDEHKKSIKKVLEYLYVEIKTFRNPVSHSGAGMSTNISNINTFQKCKDLYEKNIIGVMKNSYNEVYK
jgi:hypothetical protein